MVTSLRRFRRSFSFAAQGWKNAWRTEANFRFDVVCGCLALLMAWFLRLDSRDVAIVAVAAGLVMTAELFNTAIEETVDLAMPSMHPRAGRAKDVAAAAVLTIVVPVALLGLIFFLPPFLSGERLASAVAAAGWPHYLAFCGWVLLCVAAARTGRGQRRGDD